MKFQILGMIAGQKFLVYQCKPCNIFILTKNKDLMYVWLQMLHLKNNFAHATYAPVRMTETVKFMTKAYIWVHLLRFKVTNSSIYDCAGNSDKNWIFRILFGFSQAGVLLFCTKLRPKQTHHSPDNSGNVITRGMKLGFECPRSKLFCEQDAFMMIDVSNAMPASYSVANIGSAQSGRHRDC